jgi:hypothetical protein
MRALLCFVKSVFQRLKHWIKFAFSAFDFFLCVVLFGSHCEGNPSPTVTKTRCGRGFQTHLPQRCPFSPKSPPVMDYCGLLALWRIGMGGE